MASNLFDFGKEDLNTKNEEEIKNSIDEKDAKNIYEKYKDCSKEELLSELRTVISNGKKDGSITNDKINQTVKNLTPFLNEKQKDFLNSILQGIDV